MRDEYQTQMICVAETNGAMFELKMNEALRRLVNPDIRIDTTRPFTAYVFYQVQHDIPESITEAIEMIEGSRHLCSECPSFIKSEDKRVKKGFCETRLKKVRQDNPVCMYFYKFRDMPELLKDPDASGCNGPQD